MGRQEGDRHVGRLDEEERCKSCHIISFSGHNLHMTEDIFCHLYRAMRFELSSSRLNLLQAFLPYREPMSI